jgi:hypothetical protein
MGETTEIAEIARFHYRPDALDPKTGELIAFVTALMNDCQD